MIQKQSKTFVRILFVLFFILTAFPGWSWAQFVLEIDDPLSGGTNFGKVNGGKFVGNGWQTRTRNDYIQYDIETCPYGRIEFDVVGLYASNVVFPNLQYDKTGQPNGEEDMHYTLFNMWDRDTDQSWFGQSPNGIKQWHNPYKLMMHLFGYVKGDKYKWEHGRFRANVAAFEGGYDDDPHAFEVEYGPVKWQKDKVFRMKIEWGAGSIDYYVDDVLMAHCDYSAFGVEYAPPEHSLRLGSANGCRGMSMQCPIEVTFSNFKFYRNSDKVPPTITRHHPEHGSTGNKLDAYISVSFDEGVDLESAKRAFSIQPAVAGELKASGNTLYYELKGLLTPQTFYSVQVASGVTDFAGNALQTPIQYNFTTGDPAPAVIGKYDIWEIPILAPGIGGNKYTQVSLRGVFQGPSKRIEISGFWDGGDVWKERMTPTEVGIWSFTISGSSTAFSKTGSFQCIESENKGHVRPNPANPYTFMYDDGTPWLWKGETSWRAFTQLLPYEGRFKEYIDLRASQGYSAVQSIVVSYINGDAFWKNEGGTVFALTSDGKDYDNLNPGYFQWMDKRIEYELSKDIVPVIFFTWAQEFAKFSRAQFERFEKYMVARFTAYNVVWCLSGEYSEAETDFGITSSEWEHHGRIVYNEDPYKHPITLHPGPNTRSCAEFGGQNWLGCIMQQTPDYHSMIQRDRRHKIPVVNGEYAYAGWTLDDNALRNGAWEIFTAGGFSTAGFFTTFAPDKGGWNPDANKQQQDEMVYFINFIEGTHWWQMHPNNNLVSTGYCLANPGKEYVVYARNGGSVSVDLGAASGSLPAQWLNPRDGTMSEQFTVQGGSKVAFNPPFVGDWVLHIGTGVKRDTQAPKPPTGLVLSKF